MISSVGLLLKLPPSKWAIGSGANPLSANASADIVSYPFLLEWPYSHSFNKYS